MENDLPFSEMPPEEGLWDTHGILSPFQPTVNENLIKILHKINLSPTDVLVDLGCGDGRVLFHAAFMQCSKSIGFELNQELAQQVDEKIKELGLEESVSVICMDFLKADISEATVIYLYLLPEAIEKLRTKLEEAFTFKTRVIVSLHFPIPWLQGEQYLNFYIYVAN